MALRDVFSARQKLQKQQEAKLKTQQLQNQQRNQGELAVKKKTRGWTNVETQPIDPKINEAIYHRLFLSWPRQLSKSFTSPKYRHEIYEIIVHADAFRSFPCYRNPSFARQVMIDISGLGIIERLFKLHPQITDMGYNGTFLTYKTNDGVYRYGQQKGENAKLVNNTYIRLLINKFIYNEHNNKSLSPTSPTFDGMFGYLRVSVTDSSVTPPGVGPTFSLRRSLPHLALHYSNFKYNSPMIIYKVLAILIRAQCSTLISGETGSGKTELQKMLVGFIPDDLKIIMIEDTPETHLKAIYPNKDILTWETNDHINLAQQVAESLRNDGNWVMVSETRGPEAYQMFQSVKTGHSLTTTLHASSNKVVPSRFAGMCEEAPGLDVKESSLVNDFVDFMDIGIHTDARKIGGHMFRFIDEIAEFVPYKYTTTDSEGKKHKHVTNGTHPIFRQNLENHNGQCVRHYQTFAPSHFLKAKIANKLDLNFNMPLVPTGSKASKVYTEIVLPPSD